MTSIIEWNERVLVNRLRVSRSSERLVWLDSDRLLSELEFFGDFATIFKKEKNYKKSKKNQNFLVL